jgi:hypothetical protein
MLQLEQFISDRLTSDQCIGKYPRTARAWCGENGLERRGKLTRRIRDLIDDVTEPNWGFTFERWRTFVDFALSGNRPEAGDPANRQDVMLLVWPDNERRWLVHDIDAQAAVILPFEDLRLEPDRSEKAVQLAEAIAQQPIHDDRDDAPVRIAFEELRFEGSLGFAGWVDDHELMPEVDIYLPEHRRNRSVGHTRESRPVHFQPIVRSGSEDE